jgi:hypothetical protein
MRERLTRDDLFSYILMLRPVCRKVILVVEGDTDYAALRAHIDHAEVNVIPGYGKDVISSAMKLVNEHDVPVVIALLDRDFGELMSNYESQPNVFMTDRYDLDATIFFSGDLCDRMAFALGEGEQIKALLADLDCPDLSHAVASLAGAIGVLRMISVREGLSLGMRDFPIGEVVRDDCRSVDLESLADLALRRGPRPQPTRPSDLVKKMQMEFASSTDAYAYCSGHDLAKALAVILRKRGGAQVRWDFIERALRGAFNCSELRSTQMFSEMALWGQRQGRRIWNCSG